MADFILRKHVFNNGLIIGRRKERIQRKEGMKEGLDQKQLTFYHYLRNTYLWLYLYFFSVVACSLKLNSHSLLQIVKLMFVIFCFNSH